jgi:hypothetical protein
VRDLCLGNCVAGRRLDALRFLTFSSIIEKPKRGRWYSATPICKISGYPRSQHQGDLSACAVDLFCCCPIQSRASGTWAQICQGTIVLRSSSS